MGQYYNIIIRRKGERKTYAYDRKVDGERTMAKLMDHSWWLNGMVNSVCELLVDEPSRIAWVGDYAENEELRKLAWDKKEENYKMLHKTEFNLGSFHIVNHTKKEVLDCLEYLRANMQKSKMGWIIHPLPLLTAIGNGLGGGDYRGSDMEYVGSWAWDVIEIVDMDKGFSLLRDKGYKMIIPLFQKD